MWFVDRGRYQLGAITGGGAISAYNGGTPTAPYTACAVNNVVAGPDGAMWFTEAYCSTGSGAMRIGRITTTGTVTDFAVSPPSFVGIPWDITVGPDNNLWFTFRDKGSCTTYCQSKTSIGRITTSGTFTEFDAPSSNGAAGDIITGGDGYVYFAEQDVGKVGRVSMSGSIDEIDIGYGVQAIAWGPNDRLWVCAFYGLAEVSPAGRVGVTNGGPQCGYGAESMVATRGDALWIPGAPPGDLGYLDMAGNESPYVLAPPATGYRSVTSVSPAGSPLDNRIWFTDVGQNTIGYINSTPNQPDALSISTSTVHGVFTRDANPDGSPGPTDRVDQDFAAINFNPDMNHQLCSNRDSLENIHQSPTRRPWHDVVPHNGSGVCTEQLVAGKKSVSSAPNSPQMGTYYSQNNPFLQGAPPLCSPGNDDSVFHAYFTGTLTVQSASSTTLNVKASGGGWTLGLKAISGGSDPPNPLLPSQSTPLLGLPAYASAPAALGDTSQQVAITFPTSGTYRYELDYLTAIPNVNDCTTIPIGITLANAFATPIMMPTRGGPPYVAVGDSITTGFSVTGCFADPLYSAYPCTGPPTVTPYPDNLADKLGLSHTDNSLDYLPGRPQTQLERLGIYGISLSESMDDAANGFDGSTGDSGPWLPQLLEASRATSEVTVTIGANDLQFDNGYWLYRYLTGGYSGVQADVRNILTDDKSPNHPRPTGFPARNEVGALQALSDALVKAVHNGAKVNVTLQYNPVFGNNVGLLSSPAGCDYPHTMAAALVNTLDDEFLRPTVNSAALRAGGGMHVDDLRPVFDGHGSGSPQSYVFGSKCDVNTFLVEGIWPVLQNQFPNLDFSTAQTLIEQTLAGPYDPHPNALGSAAIADCIYRSIQTGTC